MASLAQITADGDITGLRPLPDGTGTSATCSTIAIPGQEIVSSGRVACSGPSPRDRRGIGGRKALPDMAALSDAFTV